MDKNTKIILKSKHKEVINKEMTIGEIIKKYPKTAFVFIDYGLHCVGCPMAPDDTVEGAAQIHQLDLNKLLEDLNKAAEN